MKRSAAFLGFSLIVLAATVSADYRTEYRLGVSAVNVKNWNEAVRRLRLAIQDQSKETGDLINISGAGNFEPYMPHALLGLALYQSTGRCDEALREFQISRAQNAQWGRLSQSAAVQKAFAACPAPVVPTGPDPAVVAEALQRADKAIADAANAQREVGNLSKNADLAPIWASTGQFGPTQNMADAELARARRTLDDARKTSDIAAIRGAEESATSAGLKFVIIQNAAREYIAALTPIGPLPNTGRPNIGPINVPSNETGGRGDGGRGNDGPGARSVPVPQSLLMAAGLFFKAQYREAAGSLRTATFDRPEDAIEAEWLQAASLYSVYLTSGRTDDAARTRAEGHVRACRRLNPKFLPDRRFFSPALLAFYRDVR